MTTTVSEAGAIEAAQQPTNLEYKTAAAATSAPGTTVDIAPEGVVRAIVSVTGVVDEVKDVIEPGAYADTLRKRRPKVIRNHVWNEQVGRVLDIEEYLPGDPRLPRQTKDGRPWPREAGALVATLQYNLATKRGRDAFEDVRFYHQSREAEFSIGYQVPTGGATPRDRAGVRRIKRLDLFEISDVLFGAASLSMSLDVKARMAGQAPGADGDDSGPAEEFSAEELAELERLHADAEPDLAAEDAVLVAEGVVLPLDGEDDEAAPLLEGFTAEDATLPGEVKRNFSAEHRKDAADAGAAMSDGSYPIENAADLRNAIQALGRAKDVSKARRHIIRRARALGLLDELPDGWISKNGGSESKARAGATITEHTYFPAEDSLSCECGLPADHDVHTDDPQTKVMFTQIEGWFDAETKADPRPGDGGIEKLRRWYLNPAKSKIPWGKPGDWAKCVRIARKHMPKPDMAEGFCANLHKMATGTWPGRNAHGGKPGKKTAESVGLRPLGPTEMMNAVLTGDGSGVALPPIEETGAVEGKLLEWTPDAEAGPLAAHQPTEAKRTAGAGFDDSLEARREAVRLAVTERLGRDTDQAAPGDNVTLLGTWPDAVIASRVTHDGTGQQAYRIGYRVSEDGQVVLDEPEPIDVTIDPLADPGTSFDGAVLSSTIATALDDAAFAAKMLADRGMQTKAGRVLSQLNVTRLQQAVTQLITVLEAAGVEVVPPSKLQVDDAKRDENAGPGEGGEPMVRPDTTSPGAWDHKSGEPAVLTREQIAEGFVLLSDAALLHTR